MYITDTEIVWWYIPVTLLLSHLPDIDAVPELLRRGKVAASSVHVKDHRTFLHYPVIAFLVCIILFLTVDFWGTLICLSVALHLLNDLCGSGWGLPIFWPLSRRNYKILGRRVNWSKRDLIDTEKWNSIPDDERRLKFIVSWSADELPGYIKIWGVDSWIGGIYCKITWISAIEYSLFITACVLITLLFF